MVSKSKLAVLEKCVPKNPVTIVIGIGGIASKNLIVLYKVR